MTIMLPGQPVSKARYIIRAAIASALVLAFALWMISRSTGALDRTAEIHADVPVAVGLITNGAPVRYHGVKVGEITAIDAGAQSSRVTMAFDEASIGSIPSGVLMRVLPRTFFGDIYVQLIAPGNGTAATGPLRDGARIAVDDGPDAINLYDIFTQLSDALTAVAPENLNVALTAVSRALGDKGADLGIMIDDWWQASRQLETTMNRFIDATPEFRRVVESLKRATPSVVNTLKSTTAISAGILAHRDDLASFFASAAGYLEAAAPFVAAQRRNLITIVDATGRILSTVADNPDGVTRTLREADRFGVAGGIVFGSGRFTITAVPTFSQPMPYTAADCPTYQNLRGAQCHGTGSVLGRGPVRKPGQPNWPLLRPPAAQQEKSQPEKSQQKKTPTPRKPSARQSSGGQSVAPAGYSAPPVIDGTAEAVPLAGLESALRGNDIRQPAGTTARPNPATVLMLGPMVRGSQVRVS